MKEYLYGENNPNFKFSAQFMEAKSEFMQYHARQIQRTEKNENAEFHSLWTLLDGIFDYALGSDGREPIRDPYRM